jgi:hypothetical protein
MNITISVTDEFLTKLDAVRGPASRSAFIRWVIERKVDWLAESKGKEIGVPKQEGGVYEKKDAPIKIFSEFGEAVDFCDRMRNLGWDPSISEQQAFIFEAKAIAERLGLTVNVDKGSFWNGNKFVCAWK